MTVTGHVPDKMNALQAVEAGMDQLNHINYVLTGFFPRRDRTQPAGYDQPQRAERRECIEVL